MTKSEMYWNIFKKTGDVKAYLGYKKASVKQELFN